MHLLIMQYRLATRWCVFFSAKKLLPWVHYFARELTFFLSPQLWVHGGLDELLMGDVAHCKAFFNERSKNFRFVLLLSQLSSFFVPAQNSCDFFLAFGAFLIPSGCLAERTSFSRSIAAQRRSWILANHSSSQLGKMQPRASPLLNCSFWQRSKQSA